MFQKIHSRELSTGRSFPRACLRYVTPPFPLPPVEKKRKKKRNIPACDRTKALPPRSEKAPRGSSARAAPYTHARAHPGKRARISVSQARRSERRDRRVLHELERTARRYFVTPSSRQWKTRSWKVTCAARPGYEIRGQGSRSHGGCASPCLPSFFIPLSFFFFSLRIGAAVTLRIVVVMRGGEGGRWAAEEFERFVGGLQSLAGISRREWESRG